MGLKWFPSLKVEFEGESPSWKLPRIGEEPHNSNSPRLNPYTDLPSSHTNNIMDLHQKPLLEPFQTFKFHRFFDISRIKGGALMFSVEDKKYGWDIG